MFKLERFPGDFMFQLSLKEMRETSENQEVAHLTSQIVISNKRGGLRHLPYAFTENGVAMLSSVLRSQQAININIQIMRAFNAMRQFIASNVQLFQRLEVIEHTQYEDGLESRSGVKRSKITCF